MAAETECRCGQHSDTHALVTRSAVLIEKLAEAVERMSSAEASLEVARRILRQTEDTAARRDADGQCCWCEVREASWEEEHEAGCRVARVLVRRFRPALGVDGGGR